MKRSDSGMAHRAYVSARPLSGRRGLSSALPAVLSLAETLPGFLQGLLVRTLPCLCRFGELRAGQTLILRSGEQLGDHDGAGHWVNGQQGQIEQRVDISPQQQPVVNDIRFGAAVWAQVSSFQSLGRIVARDRAPPSIGFSQHRPEPGLPPPGDDLPDDATTSIVIVIGGSALGGNLLIYLGTGHGHQDIANRIDNRHCLRVKALEVEAPAERRTGKARPRTSYRAWCTAGSRSRSTRTPSPRAGQPCCTRHRCVT
jgi:hypothetical protein